MTSPILANRFKPAEYVRQTFHVAPKPEDNPEALLDPKYWVHVSRQMKGGDRIEVLPETSEWYAEAIVLDTGVYGAKIAYVLGPVKLANDAKVDMPDEFDVKWAGPAVKFRVIRKADKAVLKEGCASREEAVAWIKGHNKAMAA